MLRNRARSAGYRFPIVLPRNATSRGPELGSAPRSRLKSPAIGSTEIAGYAAPISCALVRSARSLTSKGTKRSSVPLSASSRNRVFVALPDPSSMSVRALDRSAMNVDRARRISASRRGR